MTHWRTDDRNVIEVYPEVAALCERLGLDPNYVYRLDIGLDETTAFLYKGRDGRCKGAKYVGDDGEVAKEALIFQRVRI